MLSKIIEWFKFKNLPKWARITIWSILGVSALVGIILALYFCGFEAVALFFAKLLAVFI